MKQILRIVTLTLTLLAALRLSAEEITVFAAASLTHALTEIGAAHEKATGDKVRFNFAASNTLARQIEAGAPVDVFLSADEAQMDVLANKGLIDKATRKALLGNTLVIVTAPGGPVIAKVADLCGPSIKRISVGNAKAVPAGVYAKILLEKQGLWATLQPKLVPAENVRAALAVVESGNAESGIVYKTDAAISKNVEVALEIPAADGPEIVYPVALVAGSRRAAAAKKFLARLTGKEAGEVFTKLGFTLLTRND
jgi:molybdate transport system substrate-binding protein